MLLLEQINYTHPWCNQIFKIERKWLTLDQLSGCCCIYLCEADVLSCNYCKIDEDEESETMG